MSSATSPGSAPESGDVLNPMVTEHQWNGDPMDWQSWPTGRPGPFVSDFRMQEVLGTFQAINEMRDEQSRTEEKVFHVAEFSSSCQGESPVYCSSPE